MVEITTVYKYLLLILSTSCASITQAEEVKVTRLRRHIIKIREGIKPPYANLIAKHIVKASRVYNVESRLLAAIFMVESNFRLHAVRKDRRKRPTDYGIGQIHISNIRRLGLDKKRLLYDLEYSIMVSAMVLAEIKKRKGKREKYYWVRYNCGSRSLKRRTCRRYKRKVKRYYK